MEDTVNKITKNINYGYNYFFKKNKEDQQIGEQIHQDANQIESSFEKDINLADSMLEKNTKSIEDEFKQNINSFENTIDPPAPQTSYLWLFFKFIIFVLLASIIYFNRYVIEKWLKEFEFHDKLNQLKNKIIKKKDKKENKHEDPKPVDAKTTNEHTNVNNTVTKKNIKKEIIQHKIEKKSDIMNDVSDSKIQGKQKSGPGWCLIGDNTCAKIGVNDTCMSGDVYSTHDKCINPKLRVGTNSN
tara:strand:+ start:5528 stop:6256 length:729 start_codon:yes stop_codon:yes gene_type:complete